MTRRPRRGEGGFTLVELIVAIAIQGLIMGALAMAMIAILQGHKNVGESLDRTGDARIAANYIVSDARNTSGPEISLSDTASCPDPSPPVVGSQTPVARFNWNSTSSTGTTTANIVNYVLVSNSLLRRVCQGGALVSDRAVAVKVQSIVAACSPTADCTGSPTSITVTITETADSTGAVYQYSLTGSFRKLNGAGAPVSITPSGIILLGGGTCTNGAATGVKVAGGAAFRVYGNAKVNTPDVTGPPACKAVSLGTNAGNYQAGGTQMLSGASCIASGSSTCPTYTSYSPALANPYASLVAPSTAGLPSQAGCPSGTAQPGVYAAVTTINTNCNFASGVYIFQNGLAITNSPTITSAAGGVFFYISGGTFTESGGAVVNLTAMSSGSYAGVLMWHNTATAITISNGGSLAFNGVLYAPLAQVQFTGGSVVTSVTSIVAQSISLSGGATVAIGTPSTTPLSISSTSLPGWTVNRPSYSATLAGAGGDGIYTWSASANLPAGLALNASTGVISGTPTATVSPSVTFTLSDALGDNVATKALTIAVSAVPTISTSSPLPTGSLTAAYNQTLVGASGTSPYSWSATGLPAWASISSGGVISGTPNATGTSNINVTLTDTAGATVSKTLALTVNPQPTISSVVLANGGATAGTIQKADTITITFSQTMSVSSLCSTWSNNASNQTLNANSDVTVSVSNGTGATNDALTVTSAACPSFSLSSIDLGSNAYVSVAATFKGTNANKSSIAYTAATNKLVITLGAMTAGTVANVATSTPIYTANAAIVDAAGAALTNSPFTLPAGQKF